MTRDQIIEQKIKSSKPFLQEHYKVGRIGVFGSVARGEATPESDVDVLVEFTEPVGFQFIELQQYLENLLGTKVDLVTPAALKPQLKNNILEQVIYT